MAGGINGFYGLLKNMTWVRLINKEIDLKQDEKPLIRGWLSLQTF